MPAPSSISGPDAEGRGATVALANRAAQAIWAIMARGEVYRASTPAVA
jgi:hypothetical protein